MIVVSNTIIQMERFCMFKAVLSFCAANSPILTDTNTSKIEFNLLSGAAYLLTCALFLMPSVI